MKTINYKKRHEKTVQQIIKLLEDKNQTKAHGFKNENEFDLNFSNEEFNELGFEEEEFN